MPPKFLSVGFNSSLLLMTELRDLFDKSFNDVGRPFNISRNFDGFLARFLDSLDLFYSPVGLKIDLLADFTVATYPLRVKDNSKAAGILSSTFVTTVLSEVTPSPVATVP